MSFHVWNEAGQRIIAGRQPSSSGGAGGGPVVDLDRLDCIRRLEVEDEAIEPQLSQSHFRLESWCIVPVFCDGLSCAAHILTAFRQKLHLSRCSDFQSQISPAKVR
jgi:hypothetical protein